MNKYDAVKKDNLIEKINTYCLDNEIKLDLLKNEWDTFCNVVTVYLSEIGKENEYEKILSVIIDKAIVDTIYFPATSFPNFSLHSLLSSLWTLHGYGLTTNEINALKQSIINRTSWGKIIEFKKYVKK